MVLNGLKKCTYHLFKWLRRILSAINGETWLIHTYFKEMLFKYHANPYVLTKEIVSLIHLK